MFVRAHRNSSQQTVQKRPSVEGPQLKAMSSVHTKAINGGSRTQLVFVQSIRGFLPYEKGQGGTIELTEDKQF